MPKSPGTYNMRSIRTHLPRLNYYHVTAITVVAKCQQMEGFQPLEVLPTNGRVYFHQLEGAKLFSRILTRFDTLILVLDIHDNSVKVRNFFELSVYFNCIFCENTADFHIFKYNDKLIAGINFQPSQNSHGHQAPKSGYQFGSKLSKKFCSFQLMEGNPSISWQYFHRLEAFHLLAFGYN